MYHIQSDTTIYPLPRLRLFSWNPSWSSKDWNEYSDIVLLSAGMLGKTLIVKHITSRSQNSTWRWYFPTYYEQRIQGVNREYFFVPTNDINYMGFLVFMGCIFDEKGCSERAKAIAESQI